MKGYIAGAVGVKGFSWHRTKARAVAAAKLLGPKWWVLSATKVHDSSEAPNEGGYRPFFLEKAAAGRNFKGYSIPWQSIEEGQGECWCSNLLHKKTFKVHRDEDYEPLEPVVPPWVVKPGSPWKYFNGEQVRKLLIEDMVLNHPFVEEAWESQGTVGMVLISRKLGENGWGHFFKTNLGIEVASGGKDVKRMTQHAQRSYLSFAEFPKEQITLEVITGPEKEKLLDGIFFVSQAVWDQLVENLILYKEETGLVSDEVIEAFLEGKVGNCRIYFPGVGMIKGNVAVSKDLHGLTIKTHDTNIKKEIRVGDDQPVRIGVVPYLGKFRSRTNIGYLAKGHLWEEDVKDWVTKTFAKFKNDLEQGKCEKELAELYAECNRGEMDREGHYVGVRQMAELWAGEGNPLKGMPRSVLKEYLESKGAYTVDEENADVRARIPYSTYCQVVSYSTIRTIDPDLPEPPEGHVAYYEPRRFYVVSDEDYLTHVVGEGTASNHDSPDQDDVYTQIFRRRGKKEVWVTFMRNPVGWGQWSEWKLWGGLPCGWNEKEIPVENTVVPRSTMRSLTRPLPSPLKKGKKATWDRAYGPHRFSETLHNSGGSAGLCYNLLTLYDMMRRDQDLNILDDESTEVSPSEVIDTFTQPDNPENFKVVEKFVWSIAAKVNSKILQDQPVDRSFWTAKGDGLSTFLSEGAKEKLRTEETYFSRIVTHAAGEKGKYLEFVKGWLEANHQIPSNLEEVCTDGKLQKKAANFVKEFKRAFGLAKRESGCEGGRLDADGLVIRDELRGKLVAEYKDVLGELVPYIALQVYVKDKTDDWVMSNKEVFKAWSKWCKNNAMWEERIPLTEDTLNQEYAELQERMAEAVGYMPLIEEPINKKEVAVKKNRLEISYTTEGVSLVINGEFELALSKQARFLKKGGKVYFHDIGGLDLNVTDMEEENKVCMREVYAYLNK